MTHRTATLIAGLAAVVGSLPATIAAGASPSAADAVQVSGKFRLYDFNKDYGAPTQTDQRSSAAGAILNAATVPFFGGFGLGLGLYGSWALESFPTGDKAQETTLMGANSTLTAIGEAYAQFARDGLLLRAGRQTVGTPWMSPRDSRMLPQAYYGALAQYAPAKDWTLTAVRVTKFKSRDSDGFYRDNLYYPAGYEGDGMYGTTKVFPKKASVPEAKGTAGAGVRYATRSAYADLWYYDFYDFARSVYVDGDYTFGGKGKGWRPYLDGQFMRQTGGDFLSRYKATLFGHGGPVDSTLWGARGGVKHGPTDLSIAYDKLEEHSGSFGGGALVSPYGDYTAMFAAVMANHLLSYGPGEVAQITATQAIAVWHLKLKVAALRFRTTFSGDPTVFYLDPTYAFGGALKGLSLRDRMAWSNGAASAAGRSLVYNRVMLQYQF